MDNMMYDQGNEIASENTLVLTPSALFSFLSQIEELKQFGELQFEEGEDQITVQIGDNKYVLAAGTELSEVDSEVVDMFDEINDDCYSEAIDEAEDNGQDVEVEGGIIKEFLKTLAIGGLVRLTKNALTK